VTAISLDIVPVAVVLVAIVLVLVFFARRR
jgi:hypothetical protein